MRAFDFAAKQHWAIRAEHDADDGVQAPKLKRILDIAARAHEPDFEAVAQKLADRSDDEGILDVRGNVAVLNIIGPIFRYANLFTWISGATSVEMLAKRFAEVRDDPAISAIVLNIDSPGGEVAGISELSKAIYDAREKKTIVAYADDLTASGAYWLASAASKIVASDTAELGSIGVVATIVDRGPRDGVKSYQFVSSVSPKKRPDLETEEGRATMQQRIDDLATVFVAAVARGRGVSEDTVASDFGRGGVLIASKAVEAGMADEIGTFEGVIESLNTGRPTQVSGGPAANFNSIGGLMFKPNTAGEKPAETNTQASAQQTPAAQPPAAAAPPVDSAAVESSARKTERERLAAILGAPEAKGREELARTLATETDLSVEAAKKILAAAPAAAALGVNPLASAMAQVPNPTVGADTGSENDVTAEVQRIVAFAGRGNSAKGDK